MATTIFFYVSMFKYNHNQCVLEQYVTINTFSWLVGFCLGYGISAKVVAQRLMLAISWSGEFISVVIWVVLKKQGTFLLQSGCFILSVTTGITWVHSIAKYVAIKTWIIIEQRFTSILRKCIHQLMSFMIFQFTSFHSFIINNVWNHNQYCSVLRGHCQSP